MIREKSVRRVAGVAAIALACALPCLSGCAKRVVQPREPAVTFVDAKLRDAAESISKDMSILSGSPQNREKGNEKGTGDIYRRIDLVWDGPIEGALRKIASTAGFRFDSEGTPPETPVMIHLKLVDRPCITALREIGMQTGAGEGVIVNEAGRLITLKYISQDKK